MRIPECRVNGPASVMAHGHWTHLIGSSYSSEPSGPGSDPTDHTAALVLELIASINALNKGPQVPHSGNKLIIIHVSCFFPS